MVGLIGYAREDVRQPPHRTPAVGTYNLPEGPFRLRCVAPAFQPRPPVRERAARLQLGPGAYDMASARDAVGERSRGVQFYEQKCERQIDIRPRSALATPGPGFYKNNLPSRPTGGTVPVTPRPAFNGGVDTSVPGPADYRPQAATTPRPRSALLRLTSTRGGDPAFDHMRGTPAPGQYTEAALAVDALGPAAPAFTFAYSPRWGKHRPKPGERIDPWSSPLAPHAARKSAAAKAAARLLASLRGGGGPGPEPEAAPAGDVVEANVRLAGGLTRPALHARREALVSAREERGREARERAGRAGEEKRARMEWLASRRDERLRLAELLKRQALWALLAAHAARLRALALALRRHRRLQAVAAMGSAKLALARRAVRRWRQHVRRRRRERAVAVLSRFVRVVQRRVQTAVRLRAAAALRSFLLGAGRPLQALIVIRTYRAKVVRLQRAFRSFLRVREAQLALLRRQWLRVEAALLGPDRSHAAPAPPAAPAPARRPGPARGGGRAKGEGPAAGERKGAGAVAEEVREELLRGSLAGRRRAHRAAVMAWEAERAGAVRAAVGREEEARIRHFMVSTSRRPLALADREAVVETALRFEGAVAGEARPPPFRARLDDPAMRALVLRGRDIAAARAAAAAAAPP